MTILWGAWWVHSTCKTTEAGPVPVPVCQKAMTYLLSEYGEEAYRCGRMRSLRACALSALRLRLPRAAGSCCPPSSEEPWDVRGSLRAGPCPRKLPALGSGRPWAARSPPDGARLPMAWLTRSPVEGPRVLASSAGFDQPSHM